MAKTERVTPGREGYKILFADGTVIMNKKFAEAAAKYGTRENFLIRSIRNDFPGMKEVIVSGRERKKARSNIRLSYDHMKTYINAYENADELLDTFETVQALSAPLASPYKYVCDWFHAQFPDYKKTILFKESKLTAAPVKAPDIKNYKVKMARAA